jgi:hypothetical protein
MLKISVSENFLVESDFVDRIYPIELEIKDTTDTDRSVSYLDLHLKLGSVASLLTATLYQGNPDRNPKLWNIVSTELLAIVMSVHLRFMVSDYPFGIFKTLSLDTLF